MIYDKFKLNENINRKADISLKICKDQFDYIDEIVEYNSGKVLKAFIDNKISENHFNPSTGYGYDDKGRDTLDKVFAQIMGSEDALIRQDFASGTHAITVALFGILRPGDTVLSISGAPYDTLQGAIGISNNHSSGTLMDFKINYDQVDLNKFSCFDLDAIKLKLTSKKIKMVMIQRSCGYSQRDSIDIDEIKKVCKFIKQISPSTVVFVDNCYGEFVEKLEPCEVDADLIAGSLIKNPGGAIAPTGGYIAGKKALVEMCANRLTTPATGREIGSNPSGHRQLYMGIYFAPLVVGQALKTAVFASAFFETLGFKTSPHFSKKRTDIIQKITLDSKEQLIGFCKGIQNASAVDSFLTPEPWNMPGYDNKIIMAAGAFTLGSSIELSADAPIREPYTAFMQGGTNFYNSKISLIKAAQNMGIT